MTRMLAINDEICAAIAAIRERAMANPLSRAEVMALGIPAEKVRNLDLADRPPGFERKQKSQFLDIPFGFRIGYSVEDQPGGLIGHLSISVDSKGKAPHPAAVNMIAELFDMSIESADKVWLEEFEPGHKAVNLIKLIGTPALETKQ
jgi:hypothetical protein